MTSTSATNILKGIRSKEVSPQATLWRAARSANVGKDARGVKADVTGNPFLWFGITKDNVEPYVDLGPKNGFGPKRIRDYTVTRPLVLFNVSDPQTLNALKRAGANPNLSFTVINGEVRRKSSRNQANKNRMLAQQIRKVLYDQQMSNGFAGWYHGELNVHNLGTTVFVENCSATGKQKAECLVFSPARRGVLATACRGSPSGIPSGIPSRDPSRDPRGSAAGTSASAGRKNNKNPKQSVGASSRSKRKITFAGWT